MADKAVLRNRTIERSALKAISKGLPSSKRLLGQLDESFFDNEVNLAVYKRIKNRLQTRNAIPSWRELQHDPSFNDAIKNALISFTDNVIVNKTECDSLYEHLWTYRRRRLLDKVSRLTNEGLLKNRDEESIIADVSNMLSQARAKKDRAPPLSLGKNARYKERMEKIFTGEAIPVWKTGFREFDERGGGIAVGSLVLVAGHTGSGKTNFLQTLSVNFANDGRRVGEISLEMDEDEVLLRRMSSISGINQDKILKNILTPKEKDYIRQSMTKRIGEWAHKGSGVYTHCPKTGVNITQAIAEIEAYDYNVVGLDYASLLDDVNGKDFWQKLGEVCRLGKLYAKHHKGIFVILIQSDKDDNIKFSNSMLMHADYAFTIKFSQDHEIEDFADIDMPKARKIKKTPFTLKKDFEHARFTDYDGEKPESTGRKATTEKPIRVQGSGQGKPNIQRQGTRAEVEKSQTDQELEDYFKDKDDF